MNEQEHRLNQSSRMMRPVGGSLLANRIPAVHMYFDIPLLFGLCGVLRYWHLRRAT